MPLDPETKREFDKLNSQVERLYATVRALTQERKKKTYVNAEWIMRVTGWNKEELRQARETKLIDFKSESSRRHKYVLESIPQQFLKMQTA